MKKRPLVFGQATLDQHWLRPHIPGGEEQLHSKVNRPLKGVAQVLVFALVSGQISHFSEKQPAEKLT